MDWNYAETVRPVERNEVAGLGGVYADLLSRCPVAHVKVDETVDYVTILGYDEVVQASGDIETFSSVVPTQGPRILPLQADPPEHGGWRRMLNQFFTPARVGAHEAHVRTMAREAVAALVAKGEVDFGQEFAYPFPTRVLCTYLGIPDTDWPIHHAFIQELETRTEHGLNSPDLVAFAPAQEFIGYIFGLIAQRRANPQDDPISELLAAEVDGRPLEDGDVVQLSVALLMAGHITTTSATGNIMLRLARDPALQSRLRAEPARIRDAIEEGLRIDAPQQAMQRRCQRETVVGGETVRPGDNVLLNFGSANLDARHWEAPETFDLDRKDKRHLAFGKGIHQCLGAPLARLELRIAFEELLLQTEHFELVGEVERLAWPRLAVEHMPIRFTPRAA